MNIRSTFVLFFLLHLTLCSVGSANNDAGVSNINSPSFSCPGTIEVNVEVKNFGVDTLKSFDVYTTITDGTSTFSFPPQSITNVVLSTGSTVFVSFGNYTFISGKTYSIKSWTAMPNGFADTVPQNDTTVIAPLPASSSLAGTYTVGPGQDYANMYDAIAALDTYGICAPVIFEVQGSSVYNDQLEIRAVAGCNAFNPIEFRGHGATIKTAVYDTSKAVLRLNGASNITIDSFNIICTTSAYGWGIHLMNQADHNTISNCTIDLTRVVDGSINGSHGIIASNFKNGVAFGNNANYTTIRRNRILGGTKGMYSGLWFYGFSATQKNVGNQFIDNVIQDFYRYGIYLNAQADALVSGNDISRPTQTNIYIFNGIYLSATENTLVTGNDVHDPFGALPGTSEDVYAIYNNNSAPTTIVCNNLVRDIHSTGGVTYGIYHNSGTGGRYYYNTFSVHNTVSGPLSGVIGMQIGTNSPNVVFTNNIVDLSNTGTSNVYGMRTSTSELITDNNNLFINSIGGGAYTGSISGTNYATLAQWQAVPLQSYDFNSRSADPIFSNPATANYKPLSAVINNIGSPISGVNTDYFGKSRNGLTPDPGAIEFDTNSNDAGMLNVKIDVLTCSGSSTVSATLKNYGSDVLTSCIIKWSLNGLAQPDVNFAGSLNQTDTSVLNLGNVTMLSSVAYEIKCWTVSPNGSVGGDVDNDTALISDYETGMLGTYTIGPAGDYNSMISAKDDLLKRGICGPVVFNVAPGTAYHGKLQFDAINGSSSTNTITFNGNGATLTAPSDFQDKAIVRLNGVQYLTLDSFNIISLDTTYGWGVHLTNQADNNTIRDCFIDMSAINSTGSDHGICIAASGSATSLNLQGNSANNTLIEGNYLKGGKEGLYSSIYFLGSSSTNCNGNKIINNIIEDFFNYGIRLRYQDNMIIRGNDIRRPNKKVVGTFYGIYATTTSSIVIENNRIHNTHGSAASLSNPSYLITLEDSYSNPSAPARIVNNLLYDVNNEGAAYGMYFFNVTNNLCYYNTISIDNIAASSGLVRGVYLSGTASSSLDLKNNIISVTRGGSDIKHLYYFNTSTALITSDYNVLYLNSAGSGAQYYGRWAGTDYAAFGANGWQTANSSVFDQNSVDLDPQFTSIANDDFLPNASGALDIADPVSTVNTDIFGNPRDFVAPDPGAIEYVPVANDAAVIGFKGLTTPCPGGVNVFVILKNFGSDTLTSCNLHWAVNGMMQSGASFSGTLAKNDTTLVFLGNYPLTGTGSYDIKAWTSQPNGVTDGNLANDTSYIPGVRTALSGTYTIGSGGDFPTILASADELHARGVCGPVIFNTSSTGIFTDQVQFDTIQGVSAVNTVTYVGNGAQITVTPTSTDRAIIRLNGTQFLTLDSFNIVGNSTSMGWGIHLKNKANHNTIKNCHIDLTALTGFAMHNGAGIIASSLDNSVEGYGDNANYNLIEGNLIRGGNSGLYNGIVFNGDSITRPCLGNIIRDNYVVDAFTQSIQVIYQKDGLISGNDISRPNKSIVGTFYCISVSYSSGFLVEKNRIHNTHGNPAASGSASNLIYAYANDGTASSPVIFSNNVIYDIRSTNITRGINIYAGHFNKFYHNTLSFDDPSSLGGSIDALYQTGSTTDFEFKNNIISLTQGGGGARIGLNFTGTATAKVSDHNVIYLNAPGSTQYYGRWVGVFYTNFAGPGGWQGTNSGNFDVNSVNVNPMFTNPVAGDFTPTALAALNIGEPIPEVTTDINGASRHVFTPDPGAFEDTVSIEDVGVSAVTGFSLACPGTANVTAYLKNYGVTVVTSCTLQWTFNGVPQPDVQFNGSLNTNDSVAVSLGSVTLVGSTKHDLVCWSYLPNHNPDYQNSNDTLKQFGIRTALSGNYTVSTSGDYTSIVDAADDLNQRGICGPVVFNVAGTDTFPGRVQFEDIAGASSVNTIAFNGHGATIKALPTSTEYAIVRLNGTKYLTLDSFNIVGTSPDYGWGVHLLNQADHNTITNCDINLLALTNTGTSNGAGIIASSSNTSYTGNGNNANFTLISGNNIRGGSTGLYHGITMNGTGVGLPCMGNQILNNIITDVYTYNVRLFAQSDGEVSGNDISRGGKVNVSIFNGIYLESCAGLVISGNKIHNTHGSASNLSTPSYLIYSNNCLSSVSAPMTIYNNLLYDVKGIGTNYAIYHVGGSYSRYYYNTISLDHSAATGGTIRGVYQTSPATNIELKNNIISITHGGNGVKHGMYFDANTSSIISNNNDIYVNSSGLGAQYYGRWNGADYNTLAGWQTASASAFDQQSTSVDPEFTNISADNLLPKSFGVNNRGVTIPGITKDFSGVTRNASTPDPGALEFSAVPTNDSCSQAIPITAGIYNSTTIGSTPDFATPCVVSDDVGGGVWFKYIGTGDFTIFSLCGAGTNYDTRMRLYKGSCSSLLCVDGNENYCGTRSEVSTCTESGVTYYLLIHGNGSSEGDFSLNVIEIPVQPAVITPSALAFCPGGSVTLSSSPANGYLWNDILMSTTKDIVVDVPGTYNVITVDSNLCVDTSAGVAISQHIVTQPIISFAGDSAVCDGDSMILQASPGVTYLWDDAANSSTSSITVKSAGTFRVFVTDSNGCGAFSQTVNTSLHQSPTVDLGDDRTICSRDKLFLDAGAGMAAYNWSTGASSQTINFKESPGTYEVTVTVTDSNGCEGMDVIEITVDICDGIDELSSNNTFHIYPNPGSGIFNLALLGCNSEELEVNIANFQGQLVYKTKLNHSSKSLHKLNLQQLAAGVYMVTVSGPKVSATKKLVIQ